MNQEFNSGSVAAVFAQSFPQGRDDICRRAAECQAQRLDAARDGNPAPACTCFPMQGERHT